MRFYVVPKTIESLLYGGIGYVYESIYGYVTLISRRVRAGAGKDWMRTSVGSDPK
jgi:hypothetical protein